MCLPGGAPSREQRQAGLEVEPAEPLQQAPRVATLRPLHRVGWPGWQVRGRGKR